MKLEKFLEACRVLCQRGWDAEVGSFGQIRLRSPQDKFYKHCPITAVCLEFKGRHLDVFDSRWAGSIFLRLWPHNIIFIERAADNSNKWYPKKYRKMLLDAFGLEGPARSEPHLFSSSLSADGENQTTKGAESKTSEEVSVSLTS